MARTKLGGNGRRNQPAFDFAKVNSWAWSFTQKGHVQFRGYDEIVIASGSPRSPDNVKRVIGQMRKAMHAAGIEPKEP